MEHDPVNHPSHYCTYKREVIELTRYLDFTVGNAVKYILRAPFKGNYLQDMQKALWYIRDENTQKSAVITYRAREVAKDFENPIVSALLDALPVSRFDCACGEVTARLNVLESMIEKAMLEYEIKELKEKRKELTSGISRA